MKISLKPASKLLLEKLGTKATYNTFLQADKRANTSAARKMRVEARRVVQETKALPVAFINERIKTTVTSSTRVGGTSVSVRVDGKAIPVSKFKARQNKRGVTFKANKKGSRSMLKGAFMATLKNGHVGVFYRKGRPRLPIRQVFTSGLSAAFKDESAKARVRDIGANEYEKTFFRNIRGKL